MASIKLIGKFAVLLLTVVLALNSCSFLPEMNVDEHNGSIDSGYYEFEESRKKRRTKTQKCPFLLRCMNP